MRGQEVSPIARLACGGHPAALEKPKQNVVLRGARPADIPVEQPIKLDLVINPKAARTLDVTVPDKLITLADEVIERAFSREAKPAELPVLQSTKFELVINLNTAHALGLEVPGTPTSDLRLN